MKRNNNISPQQLNELLIIQQAMQAQQKKPANKRKTKAKAKKKSSGLGGVLFLLIFLAGVVFFVSGCTQYPECDQTQHGRGNVPAACKSLTYQGG